MTQVIGVVGASGGVGTSTLACAVAHAALRRAASAVLVDGVSGRGGLDVTCCCEHAPGYRWGDLVDVSGAVDGDRLLGRLPHDEALPVLACRGPVPPAGGVRDVLTSLTRTCEAVVLDVPPVGALVPIAVCDAVVVLTGLGPRQLADAEAVVRALEGQAPVAGLVTRGRRRVDEVSEAVAVHLDLPLVGHVPDDPRILADEGRGRSPGRRDRGALARVAEAVVGLSGPVGGPGARAGEAPAVVAS